MWTLRLVANHLLTPSVHGYGGNSRIELCASIEATLIDDFLNDKASKQLSNEERDIVLGWKKRVRGEFIMERHLKNGSIFIHMETEKVYQISGIRSSYEEIYWSFSLPTMMKMTIIPFKDVIIFDSIAMAYPIVIGSNMKKSFKDIYMNAKKNGEIIRTM